MKKGGSSALAAMIRQRSEIVQTGGSIEPPQPAALKPAEPTVKVTATPPPPPAPIVIEERPAHPKPLAAPVPTPPPVQTQLPASKPTSITSNNAASTTTTTLSPPARKASIGAGVSKCTVCDKSVFKMEEIIACGAVWHDKCFACGGHNNTGDKGCRKILHRDGYLDHENEPYCQGCYNKLFRPKGFNVGAAINTDYGPPSTIASTGSIQATAVGKAAAMAKPSPPAASVPVKPAATKPEPAPAATAAIRTAPVPVPVPVPSPSNRRPSQLSSTPSTSTSKTAEPLGGGNSCSVCSLTVYKVEEIICLGRIYHALCFTCSGCAKVLKRDSYVEVEHRPYCSGCHLKLGRESEERETAAFNEQFASSAAVGAGGQAGRRGSGTTSKATTAAVAPSAPGMVQDGGSTNGKVKIGTTSKASEHAVFKEATYVGNHDEVDESEW